MSQSERSEAIALEAVQSMKNIMAALPAALQAYAAAHNGQQPKRFSELGKYFPIINGRRIAGLYTFGFVRDEGPQPGDTLILSEAGSRIVADGSARERLYAFSDGTIVPVRHTDQDSDRDFETWEKEHLKLPPPAQ